MGTIRSRPGTARGKPTGHTGVILVIVITMVIVVVIMIIMLVVVAMAMVFREPRRVCVFVNAVEKPLDDAEGDKPADINVG